LRDGLKPPPSLAKTGSFRATTYSLRRNMPVGDGNVHVCKLLPGGANSREHAAFVTVFKAYNTSVVLRIPILVVKDEHGLEAS